MAVSTELWLGDLLRAWKTLASGGGGADDALRMAIAAAMGFGEAAPPPAEAALPGESGAPAEGGVAGGMGAWPDDESPDEPEPVLPVPTPAGVDGRLRALAPVGRDPLRLPVSADESLDLLPRDAATPVAGLAFEPLIDPAHTREIVCATVALHRAGKSIDVPRLVQSMARGEPPVRLPRRLRWSPRAGVQVLLDGGEGMTPFLDDQLWLIRQLARHVGVELMRVYRYHGCPSRGVREVGRWRYAPPAGGAPSGGKGRTMPPQHDYAPPAPGTPVLVLGDLGLGVDPYGALLPEWTAWAQQLAVRRCPPLVLLPWSSARWPPLPRCLPLAYWDRSLGLGFLRRQRSTQR